MEMSEGECGRLPAPPPPPSTSLRSGISLSSPRRCRSKPWPTRKGNAVTAGAGEEEGSATAPRPMPRRAGAEAARDIGTRAVVEDPGARRVVEVATRGAVEAATQDATQHAAILRNVDLVFSLGSEVCSGVAHAGVRRRWRGRLPLSVGCLRCVGTTVLHARTCGGSGLDSQTLSTMEKSLVADLLLDSVSRSWLLAGLAGWECDDSPFFFYTDQ